MKKIEINDQEYEVIENVGNCLNIDDIRDRITDYFDNYDYIFGDISYEKVRLKGFNDAAKLVCTLSRLRKINKINNIKDLDSYKKNYCSYGANTFLLKKVK